MGNKKYFGHLLLLFHFQEKKVTFSTWVFLKLGKKKKQRFFQAAFTASCYTGLSYSSFPSWCKSSSGLGAIKLKAEVDSSRSISLLELLTYSRFSNVHMQPYLLFYRIRHRSGRWCCLALKHDSFLHAFADLVSAGLMKLVHRLNQFFKLQPNT